MYTAAGDAASYRMIDYSNGGVLLERLSKRNDRPGPRRGDSVTVAIDPDRIAYPVSVPALVVRTAYSIIALQFRSPEHSALGTLRERVMRHVDHESRPRALDSDQYS